MKKLIFVNCVLALAVIFTYCSKPDLKEELSTVNTENVAENRAVCVLTNQPTTTFGLVLCAPTPTIWPDREWRRIRKGGRYQFY